MKKSHVFSLALISVFAISMVAQPAIVGAQTEFVGTNFSLNFYVQSGSRTRNSIALYVKQALAPLGIDVEILTLPWGQYVGFLLGYYQNQDWDATIVRLSGGLPTPTPKTLYGTGQTWANRLNNLNTPGFYDYLLTDVGVNYTQDVDPLINKLQNSQNMTERPLLLQEFNDLFYDKLLFNVPLIAYNGQFATWRGWGGPNNELWDLQEGFVGSRALGATWTSNAAARAVHSNTTTIRDDIGSVPSENFDTSQVDDSEASELNSRLHEGTVYWDKNNVIHPSIAYNVFYSTVLEEKLVDHDNDYSTPDQLMNVTRATMFLRDDAYWSATNDKDGNPVPKRLVSAYDLLLENQIYDWAEQDSSWSLDAADFNDQVVGFEINDTLRPADTFSFLLDPSYDFIDSTYLWTSTGLRPSHILGNASSLLHYTLSNGTVLTQPLAYDMMAKGFDPWDSDEWNAYEKGTGQTGIGPYELVDFAHNEFYEFRQRDDWYYPNEWDTAAYYGDGSKFAAWETLTGLDLQYFGGDPNNPTFSQEAYYWAFADDPATTPHEKPTSQGAEQLIYVTIDDTNAAAIKFEAGAIDTFGSSALGAEGVQKHKANPDLVVRATPASGGADTIWLNVGNQFLKQYLVRKAINNAIDRDVVVNGIREGFGTEWWSTVYAGKESHGVLWDAIQSKQVISYENARDIMRSLGYDAAESNVAAPKETPPKVNEIFNAIGITQTEAGNQLLFFISSMAILTISLKRRKR